MRRVFYWSLILFALLTAFCGEELYAADKKKKRPSKPSKEELALRTSGEPVMLEFWNDIPGKSLSALQAHDDFPESAHNWKFIDTLQYDFSSSKAEYGARIRGYIVPDKSLLYTFWMSAMGQAGLWISTDDKPANLRQIIRLPNGTAKWEFEHSSVQRSKPLVLKKGKRYYFEILLKNHSHVDRHLQLEWSAASMPRCEVPSYVLRTYNLKGKKIAAPTNLTVPRFTYQMAELKWDAVTDCGVIKGYEVFRDGERIARVMGRTYHDMKVKPKKKHAYQVRAIGIKGKSGKKSEYVKIEIPEDTGGTGKGLRLSIFRGLDFSEKVKEIKNSVLDFALEKDDILVSQLKKDEKFSIVWTGTIEPQYNEEHTFTSNITEDGWHSDKLRLVIGDQVVIDRWHWMNITQSGKITLQAGKKYPIIVQYASSRTKNSLCKVFWESESLPRIPVSKSQLYTPEKIRKRNEALISVPEKIISHVSPAWIEGELSTDTDSLSAQVQHTRTWNDLSAQMINRWWGKGFFLGENDSCGIELKRNVPTLLKVSATATGKRKRNSATEIIKVIWKPLILADATADKVLWLTEDDKLLVQAETDSVSEEVVLQAQQKYEESPFFSRNVAANQDVAIRFARAGIYTVTAKGIEPGSKINGSIAVHVIKVEPVNIPCEFNFVAKFPNDVTRNKLLLSTGETDKFCQVESLDARSLYASRTKDGELIINPLNRGGDYRYLVRLPDGRGVACGEVSPFEFIYESRKWVRLVETLDDGTMIVFSRIFMKPHIAGMEIKFNAIISGLTLGNSRTKMEITSSDMPINEEGNGEFKLYIIRDGAVANKFCHTRQGYFHGSAVSFRE